jgi:hypothetical protein
VSDLMDVGIARWMVERSHGGDGPADRSNGLVEARETQLGARPYSQNGSANREKRRHASWENQRSL